MESYNFTLNKLINLNFHEYSSEFAVNGAKIFYNERQFVVLQQWEINTCLESIVFENIELKEKFSRNRINIWNTYYLICTTDSIPIDNDDIVSIEREARGFRKYVVRFLEDLQRIPFLDESESNETGNESPLFNVNSGNAPIVYKLIKYLDDNGGQERKLKQKEIEKAIAENNLIEEYKDEN